MAVKEVPQRFKTTDGVEFATKAEAERHQAVVDANQQFEKAQRQLALATIESYKTADGQPFEFSLFVDYYLVVEGIGWPSLHTVSFMRSYSLRFKPEEDGVLSFYEEHGRASRYGRVSELYRCPMAAKRALAEAKQRRLETYQADLDSLRAEIGE